jgi:cytidyltransferase-like protein
VKGSVKRNPMDNRESEEMTVKKLFVLQLQYGGIPEEIYHFLPENEKKMLIEKKSRFYLKDDERKKIRVVLTGGVFDILHIGHVVTLSEAKKHGDVLVVAVAKDEHIKKKGREPVHPQEYRRIMVEALRMVDASVSGFDDAKKMVGYVQPDVIVYGYDQKDFIRPKGVEIVKLEKRVDDKRFKTSKILDNLGF